MKLLQRALAAYTSFLFGAIFAYSKWVEENATSQQHINTLVILPVMVFGTVLFTVPELVQASIILFIGVPIAAVSVMALFDSIRRN